MHHGTGTPPFVIVRRFVVINHCYLFVSGSVRVRVRARVSARVSARVTVRDRDRI